jgi:hypothetical protein
VDWAIRRANHQSSIGNHHNRQSSQSAIITIGNHKIRNHQNQQSANPHSAKSAISNQQSTISIS